MLKLCFLADNTGIAQNNIAHHLALNHHGFFKRAGNFLGIGGIGGNNFAAQNIIIVFKRLRNVISNGIAAENYDIFIVFLPAANYNSMFSS